MALVAVFSDVHGNLEALEATLRDARSHGAERFACLGDIVGYGADPNACCERVRALGGTVVRGNHDHACSHRVSLEWFNPLAAAAVRWTRLQLTAENRDWLRELPYEAELDGKAHLVHGALHDPSHWPYLFDRADAAPHLRRQTLPLCFVGHTHVPIVFARIGKNVLESRLDAFRLEGADGAKVVVNVGSVGQPRDGNPKACYVLFDPDEGLVVPRRVEYDAMPTASKILEAGLPKPLAMRLFLGR